MRMYVMHKKHFKIAYALFVLVVFLSTILTVYAYSMWYAILGVNVTIETGEFNVEIGSCKAVSCSPCCCTDCEVSDDGSTVYIMFENVPPGWVGWIGLVIANEGSVTAEIEDVTVSASGELTGHLHVVHVYFYGPYKTSFKEVWGKVECEDLPFPGWIEPPVILDPGYKVVSWIEIYLDEETPYGASGTLIVELNTSFYSG